MPKQLLGQLSQAYAMLVRIAVSLRQLVHEALQSDYAIGFECQSCVAVPLDRLPPFFIHPVLA